MDNGAKGAVWAGLEIAKVGNTTLSSCTGWSGVATLGSCTDELGTAGCATLGSIRGASTSGEKWHPAREKDRVLRSQCARRPELQGRGRESGE